MSEIISISSDDENEFKEVVKIECKRNKKRKILKVCKPKLTIVLKDSDDDEAVEYQLIKEKPKSIHDDQIEERREDFLSTENITLVSNETLDEQKIEPMDFDKIELHNEQSVLEDSVIINNDTGIFLQVSNVNEKPENNCDSETQNLPTSRDNTLKISKKNGEDSTSSCENLVESSISNDKVNIAENIFEETINDGIQNKYIDEEIDYFPENESFRNFLNACTSSNISIKDRAIIEKCLVKIRKRYQDTKEDYLNSSIFSDLVKEKINSIEKNPRYAVINFNDIYLELRRHKKETFCVNEENIIIKRQIKKLRKLLIMLERKIKELDQQELSLEDDWDENSMYIQSDRYKKRFNIVYQKLCQLTGENKYVGRITYATLNYKNSKIQEINYAVNDFYKKKRQFPNFDDMDKCVRDCIEKHKLNLSASEIKAEVEQAFKTVGKILKKRRRHEFRETLESFTGEQIEDPAGNNEELNKKLKSNEVISEKKLNEVFAYYVQKQECGEDYISENSYNSDE